MADDPVTPASSSSSDSTPYIRTYAKDVARLTGTKAMPVAPAKEAPTPGVKFAEVDLSQTQSTRTDSDSPREFPQETISVTKDDTIENLNLASPDMSAGRRDEILSRLRNKVQSTPAPVISAPSVTAIPTLNTPIPVVAPSPEPAPHIPEAVLTPAAPAVVEPAKPPKPKPEHHAFSIFAHHEKPAPKPASDLHTFKSDFADHIDEQKASTFSVLAAQSDAPDTRASMPKPVKLKTKKNNLPVILGAIVLVILGIGLLGGAYWFIALRLPAQATPLSVPSLIFADEKVEIPSNAPSYAQAIANVAQQSSVHGNVIVTYIVATTNGKQGIIKTPQPGGVIIRQIFANAPDILLRNLDDSSTVGVIQAGNNNASFFVLDVTSYERTFAGMLGWEPTMGSDLSVLYPAPALAPVGTSTAPRIVTAPHFIDSTVSNHDVRILKDSAGNTILIYGYRDKQTLIIAKDEAAFTALLTRLSAANGN